MILELLGLLGSSLEGREACLRRTLNWPEKSAWHPAWSRACGGLTGWEAACHKVPRGWRGCGKDGSRGEAAHNQEWLSSRPTLHILCVIFKAAFCKEYIHIVWKGVSHPVI